MTLLWLLRKGGGQGDSQGHWEDKLASVWWAATRSGWWETEMYMWPTVLPTMPWKKKHYLVISSAGFVWMGTWRWNWVDDTSILQLVATSSVVSASALSLEILKIAQFVWKKLTAISTTAFIYNVCCVAQDRQPLDWIFPCPCAETMELLVFNALSSKSLILKIILWSAWKLFYCSQMTRLLFYSFGFMLAGLDFCCYSESETGGCPHSNFPFFSHRNQFLTGHMWAFWIM